MHDTEQFHPLMREYLTPVSLRGELPNTRFPCYLLFLFDTAAYYIYAATWLAKIPISDTKEMKAISLGIYS